VRQRPQIAVVTTAHPDIELTITQMRALTRFKRELTGRAGIFGVLGGHRRRWAVRAERTAGWHLAHTPKPATALDVAKVKAAGLGPTVTMVVPPGEVVPRFQLVAAIHAAKCGHTGYFDPDTDAYAAIPVPTAPPPTARGSLRLPPTRFIGPSLQPLDAPVRFGLRAPMWRREDLTRHFLAHYDAMVEPLAAHGIELVLIAVGTGEDYIARVSAGVEHWTFIDHPNDPATLGRKMAAGLLALRDVGVDVALNLGSDDFVSALTIRKLVSMVTGGADFIGWASGCYFAHPTYGMKRWPGYPGTHRRHGEPIGAGRCYSARILDALGWDLWVGGKLHSLDGYSWRRVVELASVGFHVQPTPGVVLGPLVDVKGRDSAQPWNNLGRHNQSVPSPEARAVLSAVGLPDLRKIP